MIQVKDIMSVTPDLELQVDRNLEAEYNAVTRDYHDGTYHISDLTGYGFDVNDICLRQLYYKYRSRIPYNREMAGIYERGRLLEAKVGMGVLSSLQAGWSIIDAQKDLVHEEPDPYNPGCTLKFMAHPDFIAVHPPETQQYVLEIKSVNFHTRQSFLDLVSLGSQYEYPKPNHILQANFYSALLGLPFILVYVNSGDLSCRAFSPNPNFPKKQLFDVIVKRGLIVHKALLDNKLLHGDVNWACSMTSTHPKNYCPFFNQCRLAGDYGPRSNIYSFCKECHPELKNMRRKLPSTDERMIHEDELRVDSIGNLICDKCYGKVGRYYG